MMTADEIIEKLGLEPHPEGGCFREVYRTMADPGQRSAVTTIYFLLKAGEVSHWHRVDADEIWNFYAGDPLRLDVVENQHHQIFQLGTDLVSGERPVAVVPAQAWQSARTLGAWTLVGCAVAPAFEFSGFELAPEGWSPDGISPE